MKVTIHCLCDAANIAQGQKLNILGVFNEIHSTAFPVSWPSMTYVARIEVEPGDPLELPTRLRLLDEDSVLIMQLQTMARLAAPVPAGEIQMLPLVLGIGNATFNRPGTFTFELWVAGEVRSETALYLRQATPPVSGA